MGLVDEYYGENYDFPNWGKALISYARGGTNYDALVYVQKQGEVSATEIFHTNDFRISRSFLEGFFASEIRSGAKIPHGGTTREGWIEPYCERQPRASVSLIKRILDENTRLD